MGHHAPGSIREYHELTSIKGDTDLPKALEMVRRLAVDNETSLRTERETLPVCQEADDETTVDLLTQRLHITPRQPGCSEVTWNDIANLFF